MNIFYLDTQPEIAARYHCDKHCVKMILEYCQLLSTTHRLLDGQQTTGQNNKGRNVTRWQLTDERDAVLYQATHKQHPSALWVRESSEHYLWLHQLLFYCLQEYQARYQKQHACTRLYQQLIQLPNNIETKGFIEPPQAMPEQYRVPNNSVQAYRNYYLGEKSRFATWRRPASIPEWYQLR